MRSAVLISIILLGLIVEGGSLPCVSALATVWVAPCHESNPMAHLAPKRAAEVEIGDCVLDSDETVTQIYFKNMYRTEENRASEMLEVELEPGSRSLNPGQKVAVNLTANHLVSTAEGRLVPAMYLLPGQAAGGGIVKKVTVHAKSSDTALFYTLSGKVVAGNDAKQELDLARQTKSTGVVVSSYDHWTDPYMSVDTRILFNLFGPSIVSSKLYQAYFWAESDMIDPLVHRMWPMKPEEFMDMNMHLEPDKIEDVKPDEIAV